MERKKKKVKKRPGKVIHGAVSEHAKEKAKQVRALYGPVIDYPVMLRILQDKRCIRYPVKVRFTSDGIEPGLFGKAEMASENPEDGYVISLHNYFEDKVDVLPALLLYQSVLVNYGDLATAIDAEIFGSGVLGLDRDAYYAQIVALTDTLWNSA